MPFLTRVFLIRNRIPGGWPRLQTLFGMSPASLDGARVMEIGCASGGNLLPLAAAYPGSEFVGIELSEKHIADARADVDALKLGNVQLHGGGLEEVGAMSGSFDYIIAHGIYSWMAAPVRQDMRNRDFLVMTRPAAGL
ncbi:MAG: hypothetical protein JWL90_1216 [Chthoniobacteraceae bacterium]|nr:hypothetical protein [Chthoniobacteraceae bacterium]